MKYEERLRKLNGLSEFINGEKQDDILLVQQYTGLEQLRVI